MADSKEPRYFLRSSNASPSPEPLQHPQILRPLRPPPLPDSEKQRDRFKICDDLIIYPVNFVTWPECLINVSCPPVVNKPTSRREAGVLPNNIDGLSDLAMFQVQNLIFSLCDMERKEKDRNLSLLVSTKRPYMPLSARKAPTFNDGAVSKLCQGLSSASWGQRNISVIGRLLVVDQDWSKGDRIHEVSETSILVFIDLDKPEKNVLLAVPEDSETAWAALKNGGAHQQHHRKKGGFSQYDEYRPDPLNRGWVPDAADKIKDVETARGAPEGKIRKLLDDACFSDLGPDIERQPNLYYNLVDLGPYARLPVNRRLREGEYKTWVKLIRPYPLEEKWRLMFVNINTLPDAFQAPDEDEITVMYDAFMNRAPAPTPLNPET